MDQLERAARLGSRVMVMRRGTEYIVMARRVQQSAGGESLVGYLPMTGEELRFDLQDIDAFQVLA